MTFKDRPTYLEFWRKHPAFADDWSQAVADYANYDLTGVEPDLRPSSSLEAVTEDSMGLYGGESVFSALTELRHPVTLMTAHARTAVNQDPGPLRPERDRALEG